MRPLSIFVFCIVTVRLFAQTDDKAKLVNFDGYLMLEDSIPVENAYLINYRSMKIVATDSTGYFKTLAQPGDSLMVNHLTLEPQIIHVPESPARKPIIPVNYRIYRIAPVVTNSYQYQMKNFEKNMKKMYAELHELGFTSHVYKSTRLNPYNPDEFNPGLTIRPGDLIRLFKRKK
ncbi:hypothetical protein [Mangrovibacterium marinum]|nr:hypothetical protein [Mangrovibacterium marinum]